MIIQIQAELQRMCSINVLEKLISYFTLARCEDIMNAHLVKDKGANAQLIRLYTRTTLLGLFKLYLTSQLHRLLFCLGNHCTEY